MYAYKLQVLLIAFVSFLFVTSAATAAVPTMEKMYEMILLQQKELEIQQALIAQQKVALDEVQQQLADARNMDFRYANLDRGSDISPAREVVGNQPTPPNMEEADGDATNPENRIKPKWYAAAKFAYSMPNDVDGSFSTDGVKEDGFAKLSESAQINLALGRRLTQMLRAEVEFGRTQYDIDSVVNDVTQRSRLASGNVTLYSYLLNAYLDIQNRSRFTPYFGAGVGATFVKGNDVALEQQGAGDAVGDDVSTTAANKSAWIPTGMLAAGSSYDINRNLELDLAYKAFFSGDLTGSAKKTSGESDVLISHNPVVGLRYNF